jgi:hypothetical protein
VEKEQAAEKSELSTKVDLLELFQLLFMDNITFLFETLRDLERGGQMIHDNYVRLTLVMHVGKDNQKYKEVVHVPSIVG